ncbi:MAG TPA: hypothetical protein VMP01_29720 [Pirellulaceae bacterium]|nr:hypothetical protein [Pirellulaceae bacterium]
MTRPSFLATVVAGMVLFGAGEISASEPTIVLDTPMSPPNWALLERELLDANTAACREFYAKYFDERGYLRCVERWGGDDGPDDAIENCLDWPLLAALGAHSDVQKLYEKAWEGHLRQFTAAKTIEVPFAKDGMYYKEFPVMFDWLHNGEGLTVFNVMGLNNPGDGEFRKRVRRYAGFYMNEDPGAPNYDPQHKIIRSMFNGSRGPLLRKATALDWAGDPIEVENRFLLRHGERNYEEMLAHFKDYNDIVGDHPQNLQATSLAFNAFALTHEPKYKAWLLEYVDAWAQRAAANGGILPSNVGLDGQIGSAAGGKWYGGVYGWGFTVVQPQDGKLVHRNRTMSGFYGFMNAYLLTGDDRYLQVWRKQMDAVNANAREINGRMMYPRMHGDDGWYAWTSEPYAEHALELYRLSLRDADRKRVGNNGWLEFLAGRQPAYPETALRRDLSHLRSRVLAMRDDPTTPDTRLADDPLPYSPASADALLELAMGAISPGRSGNVLSAALRYFDPHERRAGLPADTAALVTHLSSDEVKVTLVNIDQLQPRTLIVQAGAYGEHRIESIAVGSQETTIGGPTALVTLGPGCGGELTIKWKRFAHPPTLAQPLLVLP